MLIRHALRRVWKGALDAEPVRRALDAGWVKRRLGSTGLYPEWERALREQTRRYPDWDRILDAEEWTAAREAAREGPAVLLAVSAGGYAYDSLLGVALTLRGARVHFLVCDAFLPGCYVQQVKNLPNTASFARHGPTHRMCGDCYGPGAGMLARLGLPVHRQSRLVAAADAEEARRLAETLPAAEIRDHRVDGVAVGEHAHANALRYYTRGDLSGEPESEAILRRYFHAALLSHRAIRTLLRTEPFACVSAHHGMYVPEGPYTEAARMAGVRVVTWCTSYRKGTLVLSHQDTYHHTLQSEPTEAWEGMPWTGEMEKEIVDYVASRWSGTQDWISYQKDTVADFDTIRDELGLDPSRPLIGLLTNVIWDAQLYYPSNAFPNMMDWMEATIRYFAGRPELQLVIRVHPAEVGSRQKVVEELGRRLPSLPPNVYLVAPERPINTYALMERCDSVVLYGTKTGVELASMGIPVIVAGEAWIRNKGLTLDASTPEEYFAILDRLPLGERMSRAQTRRARRYAYHFFLRRMIPLEFFKPPALPLLVAEVGGMDELRPGASLGLDTICDGILEGREFIYPAERLTAGARLGRTG